MKNIKGNALFIAFLVLLVLGMMLFTGCAGEPDEAGEEEVASESVLRVALTTNPNTIEPATGDTRTASNVAWSIFNSLVWLNDEGVIVPSLAEDWTVSDDGLVYTFKLREDIVFHNGYAFSADDVVFTWERGQGSDITYREDFLAVAQMNKIDEYTVEAVLDTPNAMLLLQMNEHWGIMSKQYHEEVGEEGYLQAPVGTGPFKFVEWRAGDRIVLEAFEDYFEEGYPKVDRIEYRPIPDSSTRFAALVNDDIDIVSGLGPEQADSVQAEEGVTLVTYPLDRVFYITFNNMSTGIGTPIEDKLVRQAMSYAIDYQTIIDRIFDGYAERTAGFIVSGNLGYDPSVEPYPYDPDRAKELLAEAGYPDGFSIEMAGPSETYINFEQVLQAVVGYWGEVGIDVDLQFMESGMFWTLQANRELPPLFGDSWSSSMGEAYPRLLGSVGGEDASYAAWLDPVLVDLVKEIQLSADQFDRADVYTEILRYMHEDPPFIYLYQPTAFEAINNRVKDYNPRVSEQYYLKGVSVE
ncbi:MAG: ABC transporter substrate-binding protein [Bacillota bacterium]|nr:ABC transporter substrate-binding protein [Bacillota bacterium]MDW7728652.1 ABC transporter substrate-binding protein [Bacillota bacterium]